MTSSKRIILAILLAAAHAHAVEFNRDIRPILSDRCFACHGPDNANRQANLRLDVESAAKAKAILPGQPAQSPLYQRLITENKALRMPPAYRGHDPLPSHQIALIKQWIEAGAPWEKHWSFITPQKSSLPATSNPAWVRNPIDSFILARLDREQLKPSPEANKATLLRRLTLDLTGLPPTPAESEAFLNDSSPNAYEKQVDRLLHSPRYAERMAIRWLEAARYADTNGYQSDGVRSMWRWRDWVLDAFRTNMPFDKFTVEQIAGDLLPNATLSQKIASGFHRNHRTNAEGGIVEEEFRSEYVADRVETTATVWLGLTLGCTRCHDHKYDPFTQKEFYQLFAFFNNTPDRGLVYNFGNEEPHIPAPTAEQAARLAEFDKIQHSRESEWARLQPAIAKEQRKFEKRTQIHRNSSLPQHWRPKDAHSVTPQLDVKFDYMDPFTFEAWITPKAPNGVILTKSEDYWEGEGHQFFLHEGKLRLHITRRFTDISLRLETETRVQLNQRQHVAITYDGYRKGAGVHIYIDGKPQPIKILFDELTYPLGPKQPWRIGTGLGPKYEFQGTITAPHVYKYALTPEQVSTLPNEQTLGELAATKFAKRTQAQQNKLRLAFLDQHAPQHIKEAEAALVKARAERRKYFESIPTVMIMADNPTPRETHVLRRGAYDAPGEKVTAAVPAALPAFLQNEPNNRLGLARWLVDRRNPLTARVTVNRYWQMLFGTGLVKTAEDFGAQGEWPIHQQLIDWLAVDFMESGWDIRKIIRTIVTSNTYRQASTVTPALLQKDPENRLHARGPRIRLSAEMIRDQALAASGLLVEKFGGPSVKPYQPEGLWQELSGGKYVPDTGEGLYRRSLYTYWKRTIAPPYMINFDSPTRETCYVRETRTNTPLQALNLMNDPTFLDASKKLAERVQNEPGAPRDRLQRAFQLILGRPPQPAELDVLQTAFHKLGEDYAKVASLLLNLDETVTKE
ncbi:MAG: DUF1553 domain-containing protein [Bryobacterales bacterium]|nr:DUF1553 domain-containing protein [Bryobacterales bacterium]